MPHDGESHHLIIPFVVEAVIVELELQFIEDGLADTFVGSVIGITVTLVPTLFVLPHNTERQLKLIIPSPLLYPVV